MRTIFPLYLALLIFYSLIMLLFLLGGSHDRLILTGTGMIYRIGIVVFYLITLGFILVKVKNVNEKLMKFGFIGINLFTATLICYQIDLFGSGRFIQLSILVMGLHVMGILLGAGGGSPKAVAV